MLPAIDPPPLGGVNKSPLEIIKAARAWAAPVSASEEPMPTYDYICTSCGNAWELEQRIVEDPIKKCPKCGADTAKRQISQGAGFILKGGGWYADGYGSNKPSSSESKSTASDSKSPGKTESSDTGLGFDERVGRQ
jgi:putative FmdB family regulatory protein